MLQYYLINALIFVGIVLLIVLTVGAVQLALVAIDLRKVIAEVKQKVLAITSLFDVVTILVGGLGLVKKKLPGGEGLAAFTAGLKKALQVLFRK